jgi:glycosyltransferase involved in cell wall biosynthesis
MIVAPSLWTTHDPSMSNHAKNDSGRSHSGSVARKRLCIEGWRFIHHSYAVVNQWQLLALLKRSDVELSVRDLPFVDSHWRRSSGLFDEGDERALTAIPRCEATDSRTAILRIATPLDFSIDPGIRTAVFGTAEVQAFPVSQLKTPVDLKQLAGCDTFMIITPSQWSRLGFLRLGLRPEQVSVVPHGVETDIFRPSDGERRPRNASHAFVFANVSSMTVNKGIDLLLRAFAVVAERRPNVRLLLKGADGLYPSRTLLQERLADLPARSRSMVLDRMHYVGDALSMRQMAELYRSADALVAPYRAEAFNLPVLEASACGIPVICTKHGPTDDFMRDDFALFIDSVLTPYKGRTFSGLQLGPSLDHLIELMLRVMDDENWRNNASRMGAAHAAANYDWGDIAARLLDAIFASPSDSVR